MRDAQLWQTLCVLQNQVVSKDRYLRKSATDCAAPVDTITLLGRGNQLRDPRASTRIQRRKVWRIATRVAVLQYQTTAPSRTRYACPTQAKFLGRSRPHQEHCLDLRPKKNSPTAIRPNVTQKKRKCMTRCGNGTMKTFSKPASSERWSTSEVCTRPAGPLFCGTHTHLQRSHRQNICGTLFVSRPASTAGYTYFKNALSPRHASWTFDPNGYVFR